MRIGTNLTSLQAMRSLNLSGQRLQRSSARLSSGLRIASSVDNPSAHGVSNKLRNQIAGIQSANENVGNAISLVQTADNSLNEITNIIQRIRELAVYSSNDTQATPDREKIQTEINQLIEEIDSISSITEYNRIQLINGSASRLVDTRTDGISAASILRISDSIENGHYTYTVTQAPTNTQVVGGGAITVPVTGTLIINGVNVSFDGSENQTEVFTKVRDAANLAGFLVSDDNGTLNFTSEHLGSRFDIEFAGSTDLLNNLGISNSTKTMGLDTQIELAPTDLNAEPPINPFSTAVTYSSDGNRVTITDIMGRELVFDIAFTVDADGVFVPDVNPATLIVSSGPLIVHIGPNKDMNMSINIPKISSNSLELDKFDVRTFIRSQEAITQADKALGILLRTRSYLGSYQNRLESTSRNLDTSSLSTETSLSLIRDTDMALEMIEYSRQSIINQTALSVLAQANQRPQALLQLL